MNKKLTVGLFVCGLIFLTGCVLIHVGSKGRTETETVVTAPISVPVTPEDEVIFAEIDAATSLSFSSSRVEVLLRIAARENLPPASQLYLITAVFDKITFDTDKEELILVVIAHPDFCRPSKMLILRSLRDEFNFETTRMEILEALDKRGPVPDVMIDPGLGTEIVFEESNPAETDTGQAPGEEKHAGDNGSEK
ncbi:hypothetical protein ACFL54_04685 [Planctomycetota bacterium]